MLILHNKFHLFILYQLVNAGGRVDMVLFQLLIFFNRKQNYRTVV